MYDLAERVALRRRGELACALVRTEDYPRDLLLNKRSSYSPHFIKYDQTDADGLVITV